MSEMVGQLMARKGKLFDKGMRLRLMFRCVNVYEIGFAGLILSFDGPPFFPQCC
jgi:hypothetical protein